MDYNIKKQNPGKKLSLIYFGHGLTGYYGIQKLMRGKLREKIKINLVVVSYKNPQKADCVRGIASDYGLEVCSDQINSEEFLKKIRSYSPDLGVIMNFDQKISNLFFLGYFRIGFKRMRLSKKLYGYSFFQWL